LFALRGPSGAGTRDQRRGARQFKWRHDGGPHPDGGTRRRRAWGCERGASRRWPGRRSRRRGSTTRRNESAAGPPPGASRHRLPPPPSASIGPTKIIHRKFFLNAHLSRPFHGGFIVFRPAFSPRRAAPSPPPPPSPPSAYETISAASAVATAAEPQSCEAIFPASTESSALSSRQLFSPLGNPPCPCRVRILAARRPHNTPSTDHIPPPAPGVFPSSCSPRAGGFRGTAGGRSNGDARHTSGRDGIGTIVLNVGRIVLKAECAPRVGANTKGVSRSLLCARTTNRRQGGRSSPERPLQDN